jgi:hypothetical protein
VDSSHRKDVSSRPPISRLFPWVLILDPARFLHVLEKGQFRPGSSARRETMANDNRERDSKENPGRKETTQQGQQGRGGSREQGGRDERSESRGRSSSDSGRDSNMSDRSGSGSSSSDSGSGSRGHSGSGSSDRQDSRKKSSDFPSEDHESEE